MTIEKREKNQHKDKTFSLIHWRIQDKSKTNMKKKEKIYL